MRTERPWGRPYAPEGVLNGKAATLSAPAN
jgi:hypothetical protein